jgi:hypothetical protein
MSLTARRSKLRSRSTPGALTLVSADLLDKAVAAEYRDDVRLLKRFHSYWRIPA